MILNRRTLLTSLGLTLPAAAASAATAIKKKNPVHPAAHHVTHATHPAHVTKASAKHTVKPHTTVKS